MQTGDAADPFKSHREALLLGAVRVFCTFVQHDVARMLSVGFEGDPEVIFRTAVKHQMLCGQGRAIANVMSKIIEHESNTPVLSNQSDKDLLACMMTDYNEAKLAVESGRESYEQYKKNSMIPCIMSSGSTIFPDEESSDNIDTFVQSVHRGIENWPAFTPRSGFESIVHSMV